MKLNKLFKSLLITVLGVSFLFAATESMSAAPAPMHLPAIEHDGNYEFYAEAEAEILRLVNDLRQNPQNYTSTATGGAVTNTYTTVAPLTNSSVLHGYAQYKSLYMSVYDDFNHDYTKGPLTGVGAGGVASEIFFFNYSNAGENIAARTKSGSATAFGAALFNQWLNSAGHLSNMMSGAFTEIGIGVAWSDADSMVYATQQFASPAPGDATATANNILPASYVKEIAKIDLTTTPTDVTFEQGDPFKVTNGQITITYNDNSTKVVNITEAMCSGYDSTKLGTQTITVTYEGKTATYSIEVKKGILTNIATKSSPTKTNYTIGEKLNLSGASLTLTYKNGYEEVIGISESMVSGYDANKEGTQTLTITHGGKTTTFTVAVSKRSASSNTTNTGNNTSNTTTTSAASTASGGVNTGDTTNIDFMLMLTGFSLLSITLVWKKKYNR